MVANTAHPVITATVPAPRRRCGPGAPTSPTSVYAFGVTWLIATAVQRTIGFRVDRDQELPGLDLAVHGETAYELGGGHTGHLVGVLGRTPVGAPHAGKPSADART
jgi:hypothetical protein